MVHFTRHPFAWVRYIWVREIRPREVGFRANPRFLDWGPMYRVSRRALARVLDRPVEELDGYFAELGPLHRSLWEEVGELPSAGALIQAPLLYVMIRARRPQRLIETGISSGYSARLILEALERNGVGHLDSIGVDIFALRSSTAADDTGLAGRRVGWLVRPGLSGRWTLHLGKSDEHLPPVLAALDGPLDLFLHDSLHQYPTMRWEYSTAWPHLASEGLLLSHDIHANPAWFEFLGDHAVSESAELDHDLGVARVAPPVG
ncbi:MAG: class I SAM-dependent methyltransferase [Thermoplasmata archaeon]|nr:class I SAM-dependent methyltransferase [Thermoplasmata archaeon]